MRVFPQSFEWFNTGGLQAVIDQQLPDKHVGIQKGRCTIETEKPHRKKFAKALKQLSHCWTQLLPNISSSKNN